MTTRKPEVIANSTGITVPISGAAVDDQNKKTFILSWGIFTLIQLIAPGFSFTYAAVLLFLAIPVIFLGVRIHCRAGAYFVEVLIFIFSFLLSLGFIKPTII